MDLIILAHLWVLAPFALLWFAFPGMRGAGVTPVGRVAPIAVAGTAYLAVRTFLSLRSRKSRLMTLWPYVDVLLVTGALLALRNPTDAISMLYFIPLASAVASLEVAHAARLAAATVGAYLLVIAATASSWTIPTLFRLIIIGVMASLYSWVVRIVADYARSAERAAFRTELAGEIHDGIQHLLVTLTARLELARGLVASAPERAAEVLGQERETARRAVDELRYLVRRLRGGEGGASHVDLATAVRHQIASLADRWPFALEIDLPPTLPRLSPAAEHALLRVVQESLTNAARHARASTVRVTFSPDGSVLRCAVQDDGIGFDPAAVDGQGLEGLRARMRSAGGSLEVRSAPGAGTTVIAALPVQS